MNPETTEDILELGKKNAWKEHWLRLLNCQKGITPPEWQVIVMADRGSAV